MLLKSRISCVSESSPYSFLNTREIDEFLKNHTRSLFSPFQSYPTNLQHLNSNVGQRARQLRSIQRKHKLPLSVLNHSLSPTTSLSSTPLRDISPSTQDIIQNLASSNQKPTDKKKPYCINEYINAIKLAKENNSKNSIDLDPLHPRIQQDLIKLRKLMKGKQTDLIDQNFAKKLSNSRSLREQESVDTNLEDQGSRKITNIKKSYSSNKLKPLDHVKIFGSTVHNFAYGKVDSSDNGIASTTNSTSTCSQYSKEQQYQQQQQQQSQQHLQQIKQKEKQEKQSNPKVRIRNKKLPTHPFRFNLPLSVISSEPLTYRASELSMKKSKSLNKLNKTSRSKAFLSSCSSESIQQGSIEKSEKTPKLLRTTTPLPPIQRICESEETKADRYTYVTSSTSLTPHAAMGRRTTSLLSVLLESSPCIGIKTQESLQERSHNNVEESLQESSQESIDNEHDDSESNNTYYHLLDYKHLINDLPEPVVTSQSDYGLDDFGILYEQLDHIRETMPNSTIYHQYARII